jgi:adenosyl cobinamide kinase/adenosyl cobinamide phosphate guanylyltransferase
LLAASNVSQQLYIAQPSQQHQQQQHQQQQHQQQQHQQQQHQQQQHQQQLPTQTNEEDREDAAVAKCAKFFKTLIMLAQNNSSGAEVTELVQVGHYLE